MTMNLERLNPAVRAKAAEFFAELVKITGPHLHSLHLVGSAATPDWVAGRSDINTLLVLREIDLSVLEAIAPLGKRYHGAGIAPPLVMDPGYIDRSLDVFPMEFLELRFIHQTVIGEDLLAGLSIEPGDLRRQCEREVKSRILGLRQAYLRSRGEPRALTEALVLLLTGYQPLARGLLVLLGKEPPRRRAEVFAALAAAAGSEAVVFTEILAVKEGREKPDAGRARALFERAHQATERLGRIVDELPA